MIKSILFTLTALLLLSCTQQSFENKRLALQEKELPDHLESAYFAQGCFWCVEEIFEAVKGVEEVISGYTGGEIKNPTYKQVSAGKTKHAEAVQVLYDPSVISFNELLNVFFNAGDITQVNGQGNDRGLQYRSIIFYSNQREKKAIDTYLEKYNTYKEFKGKLAIEVQKFTLFYKAEDYHQNYVKRNPNQGYVRGVSIPRFKSAIQRFPELLK